MTFDDVRALAHAWPGVEDSTSYGTPALKVKGKGLTRLKEDGDSLVLQVGFDERETLMEAEPDVFYITDHYGGWPYVLARLEGESGDLEGFAASALERSRAQEAREGICRGKLGRGCVRS
jgi:hypothetical protein